MQKISNGVKLQILTYPHPLLRQKAQKVKEQDVGTERIQTLINDMKETMKAAAGIGLAGTQVGELACVIVVDENGETKAYINPKITKRSWRKFDSEEGCLSVPGKFGIIRRAKTVHIKALNEKGKEVDIKAHNLMAAVFQHEIDHLNGVLFIDKAKKIYRPL